MGYMSKRKSLFTKYLSISLLIVLISFLILGFMLVYFTAQYSASQTHNTQTEHVEVISDMVSNANLSAVDNGLLITQKDGRMLQSVLSTLSINNESDIFITDLRGNTILCSELSSSSICAHYSYAVPEEICNQILSTAGVVSFDSTLNGTYLEPQHIYAKTIFFDTGPSLQQPVGYVFSATSNTFFSDFTGQITNIFFFASISTFVIVFCIIGFFSYNMVSPLRQMSKASKAFAKGDFSIRVPVTSRDEIGELSVAFNNMADSLSASESTRRSFIANISHELKTPMTTISGFIDGILDGTIPKDKQPYYLNIVSTEVKRLSRLVSSMLSLSRIDNGELTMNKQRFNLTEIVVSTLLIFEQKISSRKIDVQGLDNIEAMFVDGDPDMLHQVIYNLIENATKFTNEGGYIKIDIEDQPNKVVLSITNSGQGIAPEELMHIFERFYKTDKSRSQDKNGMGLGLYIVKTIMRLHGGDITARSEVDEYCTFSLWLPQEKAAKLRTEKEKKAKKTLESTHTTLTDDRMIYVDATIIDTQVTDTTPDEEKPPSEQGESNNE